MLELKCTVGSHRHSSVRQVVLRPNNVPETRGAHREQVKANIMQRLQHRAMHSVGQLCGHGVHILEHCPQQDGLPSLPQ